ncbi:hypothetical protein GQ53DRAFT_838460 [Thozetella sp. PMI_491]|nr:hypothetical protein GQ53DRAFT_838460 [Thozetella sp. PMI_491]
MPNTGRPSLDCHLCRARRVKCDLAKPGCIKCSVYGATCPGYRAESDLIFRNEDTHSVARRKQKKATKGEAVVTIRGSKGPSSAAPRRGRAHASVPGRSHAARSVADYRLLRSPTLSYTQLKPAVAMIFTLFSQTPSKGEGRFGRLDFLPDMLHETRETSCLALTADLFVAMHSLKPHAPPKGLGREELYGRSLMAIRHALGQPSKRVEDETIVAVWLLGIYEVISTPPVEDGPSPWYVHSTGIASILRARGPSQFQSERGRKIFWPSVAFIQLHCMESNCEFPPETLEWLEYLKSSKVESEQARCAAFQYSVEACAITSRLVKLVREDDEEQACREYPRLLERITDLERFDLETSASKQSVDRNRVYVVILKRSARLKMHLWFLLLANIVTHHSQDCSCTLGTGDLEALCRQKTISLGVTTTMADRILESAQTFLGPPKTQTDHMDSPPWVNGMRAAWPLLLIQRFSEILPEQARKASRLLEVVRRHQTIKNVVDRTSMSSPPPPWWKMERMEKVTRLCEGGA